MKNLFISAISAPDDKPLGWCFWYIMAWHWSGDRPLSQPMMVKCCRLHKMNGNMMATSYFLNQWWPSSVMPYGASRPQWVNIIKSPQYTGGDFMFLYRFVRRRRRPQILVHAITFEQLLGFLSFLAQLLALTCRLPDYIFVDFRRDLDLDFSRSNMEFAISQPKMVRLPRNEKQT